MKDMEEIPLNFIYQFTKLFTLGLNRKKFECTSTKDRLFAMNTSKNTLIALLFTLFSCGPFFGVLIVAFIDKDAITTEFIIVLFLIFIVGLIGFRQFLWLINGREELTIENGYLTLVKKGTFLTRPKIYSLDSITNIGQTVWVGNLSLYEKTLQNLSLNMWVIFFQTLGQISFEYKGKTISAFNDMDNNERTEVINEIRKWK